MSKRRVPRDLEVRIHRAADETLVVFTYPAAAPQLPRSLTTAEREVLLEVLAGHSNKVIAAHRSTSTRTVANLLARAFRKLGVHGRAELLARYKR